MNWYMHIVKESNVPSGIDARNLGEDTWLVSAITNYIKNEVDDDKKRYAIDLMQDYKEKLADFDLYRFKDSLDTTKKAKEIKNLEAQMKSLL